MYFKLEGKTLTYCQNQQGLEEGPLKVSSLWGGKHLKLIWNEMLNYIISFQLSF